MNGADSMGISSVNVDAREWIHAEFSYLRDGNYQITSLNDDDYNCISWAAGDPENLWWPDPNLNNGTYWPVEPREHTLQSFVRAFETRGYEPCAFNPELESGVEKVVIYVDHEDTPQHMARQLESGVWTSKLGRAWDIEHPTAQGVECNAYGRAKYMLRRNRRNRKDPA